MNLVLRADAFKISNKGGGRMRGKRDTGSDYVTYMCPACNHRNKMSMYEAEPYKPNEDRIPFKCRMCRTTIEVARPADRVSLIMTPDQFSQEMAQRRKALNLQS